MRSLEIEAIKKALAFLTSDDARDLFKRTFNPACSDRRDQASVLLSATAHKLEGPRLSL